MENHERHSSETQITFEDAANHWLKLKSVSIKPSTFAKYQNILLKYLLPNIGAYPIQELKTWDVEILIMELLKNGRSDGNGGLSATTVRSILGMIGAILQYADRRGIHSSCRTSEIHIKASEQTTHIISSEKQNRLEKYLITHLNAKNVGILISLYMGLRIGELCALKWKHIDLEKQLICIKATMQRVQNFHIDSEKKTDIITTLPKSPNSIRELPIPSFLLQILQTQFPYKNPEYYFLSGSVTKIIEPRNFQRYFRKILKITQIETVNYHSLRHTFATRCIEEGFDMKALSEILGHSSINITMNRYVHTSMEQKRKNMLKLDTPLSLK